MRWGILVRRHRVAVPHRRVSRPDLEQADRAIVAALCLGLRRPRWAAFELPEGVARIDRVNDCPTIRRCRQRRPHLVARWVLGCAAKVCA
jgi:hypothetical protein